MGLLKCCENIGSCACTEETIILVSMISINQYFIDCKCFRIVVSSEFRMLFSMSSLYFF